MPNFALVIAAARTGEPAALSTLYRHYQPRVLRYLQGTVEADAEDAASEVWISVSQSLRDFRGDEVSFRRWLFTIAAWRRADVFRIRNRNRTAGQAAPETEHWDPDICEATWASDLIKRLPADQAEIILLRVVGELDATTVGQILGKSPVAVRVAGHRGVQHLRRLVEAERIRAAVDEMSERELTIAARNALATGSTADHTTAPAADGSSR